MMRKIVILFTINILLLNLAHSQNRQEIEELYKDANSYFYFEDYEEAVALYLKVLPHYENNHNLNYKIGLCFLSIPGSKSKAIPYLEFAVQNVNKRFNEFSLKETKAPIDAIFYLANAYYINNQLNKAQKTYEEFHSYIKRESQYNMYYYDHQINNLKNSRVLQSYPVNFLRSNMGENINDRFSNFNAVISGDGKTLAFTTKRQFYQAVHISRLKEDGTWGMPMNITLDLVVDGNCSTLSISFDGTELFLYKDDNHDGNIYVSKYANERWNPMVKLNNNINTSYYETHASISADGKKLYFTSNREGGVGDLDILVSERQVGGDWGPAKNLGQNVNTLFNENNPFISNDGQLLFFSSEGHNNMGGYDIFFSQLQKDNTWSKPINLGYPINTTDDDLFYFPIEDGSYGLISLFDEDGYGEMDVYEIEIFLPRYKKTIITSADLYSRSTELPKKTLIVDTLNAPGVALIDFSREENLEYLESDKKFKLFFEGKSYDLRDQAKIAELIKPKITTQPIEDQPKIITAANIPVQETEEVTDSSSALITAQLQERRSLIVPSIRSISEADDPLGKSIVTGAGESKPTSQPETEVKSDGFDEITRLLVNLADDSIKLTVEEIVKKSWATSPTLIIIQASRLSKTADSLGLTYQFIDIFTNLMDIVNSKTQVYQRHSRNISTFNFDEDFFFNLQRIKRDASQGLALLIDNAIISDSNINSFASLWKFLSSQTNEEIKPYLTEFLSLMAKNSLQGYFNLTDDQKAEVLNETHSTSFLPWIFSIIAGCLIIGLILLFVLRKRKLREEVSS